MDKYEYKLKTEQMLELMENGAYNKAAEIADTIDWKRVRNATMLTNVSDIYERNGDYQKSYEVLNIAYHRAEGSRKVIYRLCALALKTGNVDEAIDYYDDFMQVAPKDPNQHILMYKILRARRASVEQQIEALEEFKKAEYIEEWAYELARLYQEAGLTAECLEECDDLILWFSEGKFVYKAMELKMQYKQLTPSQQEKYDHRYEKIESVTEEIPDITQYQAKKEALSVMDTEEDAEDGADDILTDNELIEESEAVQKEDLELNSEVNPKQVFEDEQEEFPEEESLEEDVSEATSEDDEIIRKLEKKGIASRMKLGDALQSLLHPKREEPEEADESEEDAPELESAIEAIESVIDLELVNELSEKNEKPDRNAKIIKFDADLEELKAEPLPEEEELPEEELLEEEDYPEEELLEEEDYLEEELLEEEDLAEEELLEEEDLPEEEPLVEDYSEEELLEEEALPEAEGIVDAGIMESAETDTSKQENKVQVDDSQIAGQLSIEDILTGWDAADTAKEENMEDKKKSVEPILPPDIQRLIDEIEGVLPEEPEPVRVVEKKVEEPHENMGEVTKQLRIDDIEEFLNTAADEDMEEFIDDLPEELEDYGDFAEEELEDYDEFENDDYEDEFEEASDFEEEELEEEYEFEAEELEEESDLEEEDYEEESDLEEEDYEEDDMEDEFEEDEYEDEGEFQEDEYEDEDEFEEDEYEDEYEDDSVFDEEDAEFEDVDSNNDLFESEIDQFENIGADIEEEFRLNLDQEEELDDREIPDEEEEMDILSATTPLSRKETAKLIATGKTAPLPLDEISDALSLSNTGFVVHGRYDLASQSGIGTRAGLTEEQKKLFSYFVPVRGMSEQLVDVLEQDRNCTNREDTSRTGNLLIIGNKGNGKTVLAVDVVKAIQKQRNIRQGKVAIVTGDSLNKKKISDIFDKLYGGALIIEKAGKLNEKTVARLNKAMERETGELLIVLEEQRKPLDRLLSSNREFRRKFTSRLEVPIFINDELVTFGQTYAQENGYRIDEMGILALYSRIDALQREDHAVTVAEVKEVMDMAMEYSQKASAKKLVKRVFGKNTDDSDRIILSEKDFN